MAAPIPMGGEEVLALFAAAIAAHSAQYLAATGVGVVQRGSFAASAGTSSAAYVATDTAAAAQLAL